MTIKLLAQTHAPQTATTPSFPTRYHGSVAVGAAAIAIALGGLIAWSAFAPLSSAVISSGVVAVDSNRKTVQHLTGGIVKDILVREGDHVSAGQALLRLDDAEARALFNLLRGQHAAAQAELARLTAERDGQDVLIFPSELEARRMRNAEVADLLQSQERLFDARRQTLRGQIEILENRIAQSQGRIAAIKSKRASRERQMALVEKELAGLRKLAKSGHVATNQVLAVERQFEEFRSERDESSAELAAVEQEIGEAQLQIAQLTTSFREEIEKDLRETQTELFDVTERLQAARIDLARLVVPAPVSGTVMDMQVHTEGGVVTPGGPIMDIVPENDSLVVEAQIRPTDIDEVVMGQPADLRFPALPQRTTPVIHGQVTVVSADRLTDPETRQGYYSARVEIDGKENARLAHLDLIPGMPVEVLIKGEERTLFEYLIAPIEETLVKAMRE
jgi:HlyD family secretion protein/epimerase transport system membrane fusion protein